MDTGSNKSLFTLLAVVIFGIFLSLSYWLFQDELKSVLAEVMDGTSENVNLNVVLMDNYIKYGYRPSNTSNQMILTDTSLQSVTLSSTGTFYFEDGLEFEAKYLDVNKTYILTYDITKLEGNVTMLGGHNRLGALTMKMDGVTMPTGGIEAFSYPNDTMTHHIEVLFDTRNLVKDGTNIYVKNTDQTYPFYYIQINRVVAPAQSYKVRLENLSIKELN